MAIQPKNTTDIKVNKIDPKSGSQVQINATTTDIVTDCDIGGTLDVTGNTTLSGSLTWSDKLTWVPTYGSNYTLDTLYAADYWKVGDLIFAFVSALGDTDASRSNITIDLPVNSQYTNAPAGVCEVQYGGTSYAGFARITGTDQLTISFFESPSRTADLMPATTAVSVRVGIWYRWQ